MKCIKCGSPNGSPRGNVRWDGAIYCDECWKACRNWLKDIAGKQASFENTNLSEKGWLSR